MMMVFMTQASMMNENEYKAYKLIMRLNMRKDIKNEQANIIYHFFEMISIKEAYKRNDMLTKDFYIKFVNQKRLATQGMEKNEDRMRTIKSLEFIPVKEHLFNISEKLDMDIKELMDEMENLSFLTKYYVYYIDCQTRVIRLIIKSLYSTKVVR